MSELSVSAVIPVYNGENYVREAVESVFRQTYAPVEILVVDDGSTDRTRDVLDPFIRDDRIRYLYQENRGQPAAQNRGAREARGRYLAFLDADDLWLPEKLERQISCVREGREVRMVFSNAFVVDEDNNVLGRTDHDPPEQREPLLHALFHGELLHLNPTLLVEKTAFREVGGFDETLPAREDHLLMMELVDRYPYDFVEEPLYRRRIHSESKTGSIMRNPERFVEAGEAFLDRAVDRFGPLEDEEADARARMFFDAAVISYRRGDRARTRHFARRGVRAHAFWLRNYLLFLLTVVPVPPHVVLYVKRWLFGRRRSFIGTETEPGKVNHD